MKLLRIEIDGEFQEYNVPENWDDITVGMLQAVTKLEVADKNILEQTVSTMATVFDMPEENVYMLSPKQFEELSQEIKFISEDIKSTPTDSIMIGDEEYFIKKDYSSMNMGEIISVQTILEKYENNIIDGMAELLCIFLRKKLDNGELESFKNKFMDRQELFKSVPISKVYSVLINFQIGEQE